MNANQLLKNVLDLRQFGEDPLVEGHTTWRSLLSAIETHLRTETEPDWRSMPEDVRTHCMGHWQKHEDGRQCAYHYRLDMWVWVRQYSTVECLREHQQ